jgi:hypothetical protein
VAAVSGLKAGGHQGLDRAADQLGMLVAEHLHQPQADQRERAAAVGQRHPVRERVDQLPCHSWGDGRRGPLRPGSRHRNHGGWRPGGGGRLQGRVDGDQAIQAVEGEHLPDDRRGDRQPQLRAADDGPLVAAGQGIRARVITGDRRGQVRDQRLGAPVDDRQQLLPDRPGIRHVNVLGKRDDRLPAGPLHWVDVGQHGRGPLARWAANAAITAARGVFDGWCIAAAPAVPSGSDCP